MGSSSHRILPAAAALTALVVLPVSSCVGDLDPVDVSGPGPASGEVAEVLIEPPGAMLETVGEERQFRVLPRDRDGQPVDVSPAVVSWSSSDTGILDVDDTGRVTARGGGTATVVAIVDGVRGEARVAVLIGISPNTTLCIECHQAEYDAQHGSPWPTDCGSCHRLSTWQGASIDHPAVASGFDLVGAHATIGCESCHTIPGFVPLFPGVRQDDCVACHQSDYAGQHAGSGFPTACLNCHTTDSFARGPLDHDASFFPIFSGKHQGKWSGCSTCHTDSSDFSQFTCFNCHEHNQSDMANEHRAVSGYSYNSQACYSCHPSGKE